METNKHRDCVTDFYKLKMNLRNATFMQILISFSTGEKNILTK